MIQDHVADDIILHPFLLSEKPIVRVKESSAFSSHDFVCFGQPMRHIGQALMERAASGNVGSLKACILLSQVESPELKFFDKPLRFSSSSSSSSPDSSSSAAACTAASADAKTISFAEFFEQASGRVSCLLEVCVLLFVPDFKSRTQ